MNKATSTLIAAVAALTLSGGAYAQAGGGSNGGSSSGSTASPANQMNQMNPFRLSCVAILLDKGVSVRLGSSQHD